VSFETIDHASDGRVARVTLDRPDVRNAFNEVLIRELNELLVRIEEEGQARALVLTGRGKAFCAGADLHWMGKMRDFTYEENLEDSLELAKLMRRLYTLPIPTIAAVNGASIGGGNGLVAACDIVIAAESAIFSLSEVKLGLVPSCIGPFVIKRVGEAAARQLFLTGERISGARAVEVGLANEVVPDAELMSRVDEVLSRLLTSGPDALRHAKELIENVPGMTLDEAERYTAEMISKLRVSPEAQEGMAAFFEKRKPRWTE
jgi:methylglutaconyl-CoA hydratase